MQGNEENEMTFDEWARSTLMSNTGYMVGYAEASLAWDAAQAEEREACATVCDEVRFDLQIKLDFVTEQNQEMRKRMDYAKDIICGEYPKGDDRYVWAVENL